jgi:intein-encoded DNA endonuclease-like protein
MKTYSVEDYKNVIKLRKQGLGKIRIGRITKIPSSTVQKWINGYKPRCLCNLQEVYLKNLKVAHLKLKELKNEKLTELSNKITPEFAYVLGTVLGDGYIYLSPHKGGHIRISVKDKDFAQNFYYSLKNWSELNCRIYQYRKFWRVYSSSVIIAKVLKNFDLDKLNKSPQEIITSFLRGLFDSEGTVNIQNRNIRFYNSNMKLIKLIKSLLKILDIESSRIYKRNEEVHIIQGRKCKVKAVYCISIGKRKSLEYFSSKVNFSIKRKQERLEGLMNSYKPL